MEDGKFQRTPSGLYCFVKQHRELLMKSPIAGIMDSTFTLLIKTTEAVSQCLSCIHGKRVVLQSSCTPEHCFKFIRINLDLEASQSIIFKLAKLYKNFQIYKFLSNKYIHI